MEGAEDAEGAHPPPRDEGFLLRVYAFAFKIFLPHRQ